MGPLPAAALDPEKWHAVIYRFGIFDFEADSGVLRKHARPVSLERQPARVLAVLLARAGELVSREELRESVWGRETHVDFDRGLAYCLSQVRAALGDRGDNPRFVQTFPKRGYKFIAPVTVDTDPPIPSIEAASPAQRPARTRAALVPILAPVSLMLLLAAGWLFLDERTDPVLIAVSVFDNETGVAEYDRPIAGLADLVVANLANLAPGRLAVIGNADVLRRPRNIRNLKAVRDGIQADYVLLGQLQQGEQGLRFITHFIRLRDMAHLKANRLPLSGDGIAGLEVAVVDEFQRAVREHVLTNSGN
jgi:DNA-binding winged helix-turn-helix (wHTH) protein/TolB-like protein